MTEYVVDASVAVKWFVPEVGYERATLMLDAARTDAVRLTAPDLIVPEFCSAIARKVGNEITFAEAEEMVSAFLSAPVRHVACRDLAARALALAHTIGASIYDALYLAAGEAAGATVVTADEELVKLARRARLGHSVTSLAGFTP